MKRLAVAILILLCGAGCAEHPRPHPRTYANCPFVIRLTAAGDLFANDCRTQQQITPSTLGGGLRTLLGHEEWDLRPPPILIDIDDAAPLSLTHEIFNRLQDNGFYSVGLADGPGRAPIMIALPPPPRSPDRLTPIGPLGPRQTDHAIDPATTFRIAVVRIRPDHQLEVTEYPFSPAGMRSTAPGRAKTVTVTAGTLPALLASYPKGRYAGFHAQADTPWSELRAVFRALAQAGRDQIVLVETPY